MNRRDFQRAFGDAPEDFRLRLRQTLDGLEEKEMKKRYKFSTVLVAAVLMVAVLTGAGIAAGQLGIFDFLKNADPIVPLPGAEELVATNLGTVENDLAVLTVEEAVFDGQGVLVKCRMTPKDTETYALFDAFMQDAPEDTYIRERVPVEIVGGTHELESESGMQTVINENGEQKLLLNGEEVEIPASREAAQEAGLIVYRADGKLWHADFEEFRVQGRRDGKQLLGYWISMDTSDDRLTQNTADARVDGDSIVWWGSGIASELMDANEIEVRVLGDVVLDDEMIRMDEIRFMLPKNEAERKYNFTPAGNAFGERFEIENCSLVCTKVRGYMKIEYRYQQAPVGEELGIDFRLYDAEGNRINIGGGGQWEENGLWRWQMEMQSFEEIPETIFLEAKVIGEDKILGRVECKLVEE